jgi:hypothetical protein
MTTMQQHEQLYLVMVMRALAFDTLREHASRWNDATTRAQLRTDTAVIAATERTDKALLGIAWPPAIKADVNALVTVDAVLERALNALQNVGTRRTGINNLYTAQAWWMVAAAENIVRRDLGLTEHPLRRPLWA